MSKKLPTIISLFALLVLVFIQSYVIISYYEVKSKNYDISYSRAIISTIENKENNFLTDTLDVVLNQEATWLLKEHPKTIKPSLRDKVLARFDGLLSKYDSNSAKIRKYLADNKLDTFFQTRYLIKEISLLDFENKIQIYRNEQKIDPKQKTKGLYIKSYYKEGNYYIVQYDYFVDLTHKQKVIFSEMKGLLVMVILTMAAVILTFVYTLRTLQRQKKLSELKDDFINNITHEFKTPLSIISVAASSIKQHQIQTDTQKLSEIGTVLERQNKLLSKMIDNVIDVSLLDGKSINVNKELVNVKQFMTETITSFVTNETNGKNIRVLEEYALPDEFTYKFDTVQFSRVIHNLLSNAVKYCEGDPVIKVRVKVDPQLKIEIEDNGIGIKEEHLKTVFNKFFRIDNTPVKAKGLGLGLYIVKRIVENHKGAIYLESQCDKGTTVVILLPT